MTQQKMSVLKNFDGSKLEEMLKTSTKNVAQEVVSILINHWRDYNYGILPDLEINFLKKAPVASFISQNATQKSRGTTNDHYIDRDNDDWEEDEEKEEDVTSKPFIAASSSSKLTKFSNISDFNNRTQNQLPSIPPSVNYNNYFNKPKYRYTSKPKLAANNSSSMTSTQPDFKSKIQNLATSSKSNQNGAPRSEFSMRSKLASSVLFIHPNFHIFLALTSLLTGNSQKEQINDRRTLRPNYGGKEQDMRNTVSGGQDFTINHASRYNPNLRIQ